MATKKRGKKSKNKTNRWDAKQNKWVDNVSIESIENKVLIESESEDSDNDIISIINEDEEEEEIETIEDVLKKQQMDIEEYYANRYGS